MEMLLALLRESLQQCPEAALSEKEALALQTCDWQQLLETAKKHGVLSLLYDSLEKHEVPERAWKYLEEQSRIVVRQNYRLWILTGELLHKLREKNIPVVLLKGMGTASFYPVPELRKSGDVDLLLPDETKLQEAMACLEEFGCVKEEVQLALHHVVYGFPLDGKAKIEIELHTMLAEPFDDRKVNELLQQQARECGAFTEYTEVAGVELWMLARPYHAYELLLHMLQHFLRSGFGLKLLCDWVVFWNHATDEEEERKYLALVSECGIKKFSDLVTICCIRYLGLDETKVAFMALDESLPVETFLQEIMEAEEFGKSSKNRMVALRGNGLWDYVREFHHQMHLNYPTAGKCFLLWPVLWMLTLLRFLINNRRIRKTSLFSILKKAGERGEMIQKLDLFQ